MFIIKTGGDKVKNFNICIDIDGTITEPYYWLDIANRYFNKNVAENKITDYSIPKVMGVEECQWQKFYDNNKMKIHWQERIRKDVKDVLRMLNLESNIYFVTARDKDMTMMTHAYLKKNKIPYDELFVLGSAYKVDKAMELNCSIFIEDCYDNAIQLADAGFKVLLIDTNYNRKSLNRNILRVYNWREVYFIVNKLLWQSQAV